MLAARASAPQGGPRVAERAHPARDPVAARPRARAGQSPRLENTGLGWTPDPSGTRPPRPPPLVGERGGPNRTRFCSGCYSEQTPNKRDSVVVLFGCMALDLEFVSETGGTSMAHEFVGHT